MTSCLCLEPKTIVWTDHFEDLVTDYHLSKYCLDGIGLAGLIIFSYNLFEYKPLLNRRKEVTYNFLK